MESSLVKSGGSKKSKKNRSVDTQSLNNNAVSRTETSNGKRKGNEDCDELEKKRKKKASRKEAFLNSFEVEGKKSRSNVDKKAHSDGVVSENSTHSDGKADLVRSLASSPYGVPIPKRPRGFVGRKESQKNHDSSSHQVAEMAGDQVNRRVGSASGKVNSDDKKPKSNGGVKKRNVSANGKGKLVVDGKKKSSSCSSRKIPAPVSKTVKEVPLIVNNEGDASSSRNESSIYRKRKGSESLKVKVEPTNASSLKILDDSPDEDEDNLEQNAAMMLSSRFDPSCTQFSPKSKSPVTNGNSSLSSAVDDSSSRKLNMSVGFELASGDLANRVLRSREKHKRHSLSKKRRHFYEIFSRDMDAHWVLNRRISVFWPLDESWYYGWVSEYSPETKLHHIKYDDQDEEWVDLKNERYKLLLFPGEVPLQAEPKGDAAKFDDDRDLPSDDSLETTYLDSEPIKSWVNRSRRVKSAKRQKASHLLPKSSQMLSAKVVSTVEQIRKSDPLKRDANKLNCYSSLPDSSSDLNRVEQFQLGGGSFSGDGNSTVVYVRRRSNKKDNRLILTNGRGLSESDRRLWYVDNVGLLKLRIPFAEYKEFRFELGLPVPYLSYTFGAGALVLYRALFLLKYGTIVNIWPKVHLDILFVDSDMGLQFLLFQGSLKQAVEFVLLVMEVFYRPDQKEKFVDMSMPVTSIRFKLSCFEDSRKQYVFEVHSFSQVKGSKWLFFNSKLQQHCSLSKQVPLSECTYDNIMRLERGGDQLPLSSTSRESCINEGHWKESLHAIMIKGDSVDSLVGDVYQSPSEYSMTHRNIFPSALSFIATPSVSLHMQLLMEANVATISPLEAFPSGDSGVSFMEVESSKSPLSETDLGADMASERSGHDQVKLLDSHLDGKFDVSVVSASFKGCDKKTGDAIVGSLEPGHVGPRLKPFSSSRLLGPKEKDHELSVEVPSLQPDGRAVVITPTTASLSSDMASNLFNKTVQSVKVTGPTLMLSSDRNRNTSYVRLGGEREFINSVFSSGPRKRRTQVQYTLPSDGLDSSTKNNSRYHRGLPYQRIRKASDNRASEVSKKVHRNKGLLACDANVLITVCDKGWRECGARVELESADRNEWKLSVSLSGTTKYSYKANRFLQSASTNRFTHAKMWRGGKDWALEFSDRNQWMVFKEMYEECFNRNLRAASVKNIPIPGVQLIEVCDSKGTELPFVRSSNYVRQIETDAEMAMNPSRVLYDMDSEDETWMLEHHQKSTSVHGSAEVTEEFFERTMDMFEKVAFARQRDDFRLDEIEETMVKIGPMVSVKPIHEHWRRKRLQKGMPLVRHLRPSLWEHYQLQVKEWEQAVVRSNSVLSSGSHDKAPPPEKPPTFAFCLKPRGLEMPNKGTKQRSHRRYQFSESSTFPLLGDHHQGDQSGFHATGRRSNGNANYGDEKVMYLGNSHEYTDTSPPVKPRVFSPRDAGGFGKFPLGNGAPEFNNQYPHRNKSKNAGFLRSTKNLEMLGAYNQRTIGKINEVDRWNTSLPKWSNQKHNQSGVSLRYGLEQLDGSDLDEFRLRDASSAAQHARNMARLKREKAQRLLFIANVATHNAVTAVMNAEVTKASFEESDKEDDSDDDASTDDDLYGDDSDEDDDSDDSDRTR